MQLWYRRKGVAAARLCCCWADVLQPLLGSPPKHHHPQANQRKKAVLDFRGFAFAEDQQVCALFQSNPKCDALARTCNGSGSSCGLAFAEDQQVHVGLQKRFCPRLFGQRARLCRQRASNLFVGGETACSYVVRNRRPPAPHFAGQGGGGAQGEPGQVEAVPCVYICRSATYTAAVPPCRQAKEIEARKASLAKWKLDLLHKLMDTLDLQRGSGDKVGSVAAPVCFT